MMREHNTVIKEHEMNMTSKEKTLKKNNGDNHFKCSEKLIHAKRELFRVIVALEKAEHSQRSLAGQLKNTRTVKNKGKVVQINSRMNRNIAHLNNQFNLLKDRVYKLDQLLQSKIA